MLAETEALLTTDQVSAIIHKKPWTVRDMCRRGIIPSLKVGSRVLIPREGLESYLQGQLDASRGLVG